MPRYRSFVAALLVAGSAALARGADPTEVGQYPLGKVDFSISCMEANQDEFNRAIALLHHMTYAQARQSFMRVADSEPDCPMAYWGIAMTLFQPLWPTRPTPEELQQGWKNIQKAKALRPQTKRERLFVTTAEAFFREPESTDYWERIRRWEQALEKLYLELPKDPEAAAFYALALLAEAQRRGGSLKHHERAAEILLSVHKKNPIHPASIHYLIHANDVRGREQKSLKIVRSYGAIAPRNPHALHMPTHIFVRLGSWDEVIQGNVKASEAALEHSAGDDNEYISDEFPHAIEYLVYAYLQQGADDLAAAQLKRLQSTERLQPTFKTAFHLSSIPARHALERRVWDDAAELVPRNDPALEWSRFPWPEAVTWFARGLGAAHIGRLQEAKRAEHRLGELEAVANQAGEEIFARQIRILRLGVEAWTLQFEGKQREALNRIQKAAKLEASTPKHPVTPAPTLPAYELLGDLLMEQQRPDDALVAYEQSIELYPKRFNGLLGAARAARALGQDSAARNYYVELIEVSSSDSRRPALSEARTYVSHRR